MTFTVLGVCAANICRSPLMALGLERSFLTRGFGGDVAVWSAGVSAAADEIACAEIARLAKARGLPSLTLEKHRAAPLTDQLIDGADLILAADRAARSEIVKRGRPRSIERTFTLREAAQLAEAVSHYIEGRTIGERLQSLATQMNHHRGFTDLPGVERVATMALPWRRLEVHTHDVPDAHGDVGAPHRLVFRLIIPAADRLAGSLSTGALAHLR